MLGGGGGWRSGSGGSSRSGFGYGLDGYRRRRCIGGRNHRAQQERLEGRKVEQGRCRQRHDPGGYPHAKRCKHHCGRKHRPYPAPVRVQATREQDEGEANDPHALRDRVIVECDAARPVDPRQDAEAKRERDAARAKAAAAAKSAAEEKSRKRAAEKAAASAKAAADAKKGYTIMMIDPDAPPPKPPSPKVDSPVRPSAPHSHVATIVSHEEHAAVSVPMLHTVDHEEFNVPPMSSSFLAAIHAAESHAPRGAIKVI